MTLPDELRKQLDSIGLLDQYDRAGTPIAMSQWVELAEDPDYRMLTSDDVGPYWVSTIWLGINHRFGSDGPPIIFETMVFSKGQRDDPDERGLADFDCRRWCTEEEALAGHAEMVTLVRATLQEEP